MFRELPINAIARKCLHDSKLLGDIGTLGDVRVLRLSRVAREFKKDRWNGARLAGKF
jgi:hypothetical protein